MLSILGTEIEREYSDGSKKKLTLPSEQELWLEALLAKDIRVRLDALKYLTDRRDGKPPQHLDFQGGPRSPG